MNSIITLPKRATGNYLKLCKKEIVRTNLYKVDFNDKAVITIYNVSIEPFLPNNSYKFSAVVDSAKQAL
jgi:hypothetical protein